MKSIILGLALIAAVSCDVSHLQGQGWSKDENGYHYDRPATKLDEPAPAFDEPLPEEPYVPEIQVVEEVAVSAGCANGGFGQFCCINGADNEDCFIASDEPVVEDAPVYEEVLLEDEPVYQEVSQDAPAVTNEYLPPNNEYLPPALRKRQVQVKRQIPVRRVVQAKRQVPARRQAVPAKRVVQVKRQAPVRRVVQVRPQQAKNYRVVRRS